MRMLLEVLKTSISEEERLRTKSLSVTRNKRRWGPVGGLTPWKREAFCTKDGKMMLELHAMRS